MCLFFLVGIAGLYTRQVEKAGWLGLAGFALLIVSWWLLTAFVFAEAFILPPLAGTAPEFVDALLGISYGHTGGVDLGVLPTLFSVGVGISYMLGGLLFGIATFRAGVLPRLPAGATVFAFDAPAVVGPGVPVINTTLDLSSAMRISYATPGLLGVPLTAPASLICAARGPSAEGFAGSYGDSYLVDVGARRSTRLFGRAQCVARAREAIAGLTPVRGGAQAARGG